jgi:hypothetical protein
MSLGGRTPKGSHLILHHPQSPSSQAFLGIHRSMDEVAHFQASSLEMRAPLCSLPKLENHFSYNTHLGTINGQAPKNGLAGQGHHHPKRG